ncbi:MAG: lipase/acyltransferase domain-containing protein [Pyrinomonadaceae bacterium]
MIRASDGSERWPGIGTFHDGLTLDPEDSARIEDIVPGGVIRSIPAVIKTVQVYGPLWDRLRSAGYQPDGSSPTLFAFPYDWRKSNAENADALGVLIKQVRDMHSGSDVDIVAHSMGGILAQRYILKNPNGGHHVAKLITIATPWLGAPKLVNTLETGEYFDGLAQVIIRQSTLKKLVEFFPGAHELIPSQRYFELGGVPFRESGWDINGDGISTQNYNFSQLFQLLNERHPRSSPATNGLTFHNGVVGQDGWSDGVDGTGVEYFHFYGMRSGADTIGTVIATKRSVCSMSGVCVPINSFEPLYTLGDKTVPLVSARRSGNGIKLNAAGATLKLFAYNTNNNDDVDHLSLARNNNVLTAVVDALNSPLDAAIGQAKLLGGTALADPPEPPAQPHYYVKLQGVESLTLTDSHGSILVPLSGEPNAGISGVTVYVSGEKSVFAILPLTDSYELAFAANTPVALEIRKGTDVDTSEAVRYADLNLPAGVRAKLQITPQGIGVLQYDTNGDGAFETSVTPTVSVTGTAAQDTDAPVVSITSTAPGNSSLITITSSDANSGVKATYFSVNGSNFQPYTAPFTVNQYQAPAIHAFADDNVGNRSSLVTHQLISFGVPVLVTQPNSTRAIAFDSVLRTAEPFHLTYDQPWASDRRTRIMLFVMNFELAAGESASAVTASAQDGSSRVYSLPVEYVSKVPGSAWLTCVIVKLNDEIGNAGDILVRINYRGISSNGVRIGIGHIGGGPPDSAGVSQTPRSLK